MELKAQKKFGQNFLKDETILSRIASSIEINPDDLVIEIGPGMGALTKELKHANSYLLPYEIDERMKPYLEQFETEKSHIFYGDFLKRNLIEDIKTIPYKNLYVIANIPYYITSPILAKLIEQKTPIQKIVLLVQKEFGYRLCAKEKTKDYNAFTLYVDAKYDARVLFEVGKEFFVPVPKVDSVVIELVRNEKVEPQNFDFYLRFVRDAFQNKRKTLKNNMKSYDFNKIKSILATLGYQENVRAEEISKEDFRTLASLYKNK